MKNAEILVAIHLSATAIYAVIGNVVSADDIRIMGLSEVKINDFYQGHILNQDRLKRSIKQAIQEAEDMANCRVHSVWLSFSTPELLSTNSYGRVSIENDAIEIRDIVDALGQAKQRDMPTDHYLMQHVQQGVYVNDESQLIEDPIGTFADVVTVMYHLMMLPVRTRQNMEVLLRPSNVRVDHMVFDSISSAEYSLIAEEREQGVCFIDIGYSSTSVCVYKENKLVFTDCLPYGAHEVTLDISSELRLTMVEAESLKKRYGTVDRQSVDPAEFHTIKRQGSQDELTINSEELAEIIEARYIEIFKEVFSGLYKANLADHMERGVVLSGGGSNMRGLVPFAKRLLNMPVVLSNPHPAISASNHHGDEKKLKQINQLIENPDFHTPFGTLLYSQSEQFRHSERSSQEALLHTQSAGGLFTKSKEWFEKVNDWFTSKM